MNVLFNKQKDVEQIKIRFELFYSKQTCGGATALNYVRCKLRACSIAPCIQLYIMLHIVNVFIIVLNVARVK